MKFSRANSLEVQLLDPHGDLPLLLILRMLERISEDWSTHYSEEVEETY
jgi:hypothetical protein